MVSATNQEDLAVCMIIAGADHGAGGYGGDAYQNDRWYDIELPNSKGAGAPILS